MMILQDVIKKLTDLAPEAYAQEWDNVGLLVGDRAQEISKIFIALDADETAIAQAQACGAQLLLTHHPMIFSPLKRINTDEFIGARVVKLLQAGISCYAMHTNYDAARMGTLAAERLGIPVEAPLGDLFEREGQVYGIGTIGNMRGGCSLKQLGDQVKQRFGLQTVKIFGDLEKPVSRVAICPGAGKSMIGDALCQGAQVFITGDIDHHSGIDAVAQGLCIIDAGHYGIEHIFISDMQEYISRELPQIEAVAQERNDPFVVL